MAQFTLDENGVDITLDRGGNVVGSASVAYNVFLINSSPATVNVDLTASTGTNLAFTEITTGTPARHNDEVGANVSIADKAMSVYALPAGATYNFQITRSGSGGSISGSAEAVHGTVAALDGNVWIATGN